MNIRLLPVLAAILIASSATAQQVKIATVDMAALLNGYYKTTDANEKIRTAQETAQREVERLTQQGQELVRQYEELRDRAENPAITETARNAAVGDVQTKETEIREKQAELQNLVQNTQRLLQGRIVQHCVLLLDEIRKVAVERAQARGANLVLDTSGLGGDGLPSVIHADPTWNITDEVLREINRGAPPGFTPPAPGSDN